MYYLRVSETKWVELSTNTVDYNLYRIEIYPNSMSCEYISFAFSRRYILAPSVRPYGAIEKTNSFNEMHKQVFGK